MMMHNNSKKDKNKKSWYQGPTLAAPLIIAALTCPVVSALSTPSATQAPESRGEHICDQPVPGTLYVETGRDTYLLRDLDGNPSSFESMQDKSTHRVVIAQDGLQGPIHDAPYVVQVVKKEYFARFKAFSELDLHQQEANTRNAYKCPRKAKPGEIRVRGASGTAYIERFRGRPALVTMEQGQLTERIAASEDIPRSGFLPRNTPRLTSNEMQRYDPDTRVEDSELLYSNH